MAQVKMPAPEQKKVTEGTIKVTKKAPQSKESIFKNFFAESFPAVRDYVVKDFLLPSIKSMAFGAITSMMSMALFGQANRPYAGFQQPYNYGGAYKPYTPPPSYYPAPQTTPYNGYYSSTPSYNPQRQNVYDYAKISFTLKADAERVLGELIDRINNFQVASVADFYRAAGVPITFTDERYGWTDIRTAHIERTQTGEYIVVLPKAYSIS